MTNHPCRTVCPNCGNEQDFFLSQIHEGKRCNNCKIKLITPDENCCLENTNLDYNINGITCRQIISYEKLYSTKKERYGSIHIFQNTCIHGFWGKNNKCKHERLKSFYLPIGGLTILNPITVEGEQK